MGSPTSETDPSAAFRDQAKSEGLIVDPHNSPEDLAGKPIFHYDLNMGPISGRPEAEKVFALVSRARDFGLGDTIGEHMNMLSLYAEKNELASGSDVHWTRLDIPSDQPRPENLITLKEWLIEQKQPLDNLKRKK